MPSAPIALFSKILLEKLIAEARVYEIKPWGVVFQEKYVIITWLKDDPRI